MKRLKRTQQNWLELLNSFSENDYQKIYLPSNISNYKLIHGLIQHDAYHLGQIAMLKKFVINNSPGKI